jgi:hypothetical protein
MKVNFIVKKPFQHLFVLASQACFLANASLYLQLTMQVLLQCKSLATAANDQFSSIKK